MTAWQTPFAKLPPVVMGPCVRRDDYQYAASSALYALAPFARAAAFDSACRPVRAETEREVAKALHGRRERGAVPHQHRDLPFDGPLQQRQEIQPEAAHQRLRHRGTDH